MVPLPSRLPEFYLWMFLSDDSDVGHRWSLDPRLLGLAVFLLCPRFYLLLFALSVKSSVGRAVGWTGPGVLSSSITMITRAVTSRNVGVLLMPRGDPATVDPVSYK